MRKPLPRLLGALLALLCLAPAALGETRLMVVSDLHYIDPVYYEGSDSLMHSAMFGDGKTPHLSPQWLAALEAEALAIRPDALLLLGDQTFNGEVLSHRAVSDALARVQAAGIPVYAIPGNHDLNNDNAHEYLPTGVRAVHSLIPSRYEKYYGAFGLAQALSRDIDSWSYAVALRDDLWLVMLDAGVFEPFAEAFGNIKESTRAWLADTLDAAKAAGAQVISTSHQSMLPHSSVLRAGYMVINWEDISALLRDGGVRLHMSGHLHIQHIAESGGLIDAALSSLSNQPNQYALVTIDDAGGILYRTQPLSPEHLPKGAQADAHAFSWEISHYKAMNELRGVDATDDTKQAMAAYAADVNLRYYAGTVHEVYEEALADPALALWRTLAPESFWAGYLDDMLAPGARDMTLLMLPARE